MMIPFVHTTAAGLYVSKTHVDWVSGTRLGQRLRRLESTSEPVEDGDVEAALRRLVERVKPKHPYVVTHLGPLHVRHAVLQGPTFDDAVAFDAWLQAEVARRLPPRAKAIDFIIRYQLLEETEEYTRCVLAIASHKAVEQREALLREVGLEALHIGSIDIAIGEALALTPSFVENQSAVLIIRADDAALLQFQVGVLQTVTTLPYGIETTDLSALLQEVDTHLMPAPDRLFIVGDDAKEVVRQARELRLFEGVVQEATLDVLPDKHPPLDTARVPAAALAFQHLFPVPDALDFLEPKTVVTGLQALEKREATRAILSLGSLVGIVFLVLFLTGFYLDGKRLTSEATLNELADQVARIEQAHEAVQQLERDIAQAERLVVERTHVARVLEGVGRVVPEGLWLETVDLEEPTLGISQLTLKGIALSEGDISTFMERLEHAPYAVKVRLVVQEAAMATTLYKQIKVQDRVLTRFEIQLRPAATPDDPEVSG